MPLLNRASGVPSPQSSLRRRRFSDQGWAKQTAMAHLELGCWLAGLQISRRRRCPPHGCSQRTPDGGRRRAQRGQDERSEALYLHSKLECDDNLVTQGQCEDPVRAWVQLHRLGCRRATVWRPSIALLWWMHAEQP